MNRERLRQILELLGRHRFNTVCVVVMLIGVVVAAGYLRGLSALQAEYDAVSLEGQGTLDVRKSGPTLREELAYVKEAVRLIDENLFDEYNRPENYEYFRDIAFAVRAVLADCQQLNALPVAGEYKCVPFTLRVTGTYQQLHAFIYGVETGPRLSNVLSFTLRRIPGSDNNLTLQMNVELLARS